MLENVKFLLVDDIEENLIALSALLKREGLELFTARSGEEALELVLEHDFALAFIDVQMPEMNGFELAELLRGADRSKHVPIIFLTAGSRNPNRVFAGYETGAVDFLFKPVEPRILQGKADVFFQLYRRRQELSQALRLNEMFVGILGHDLRTPLSTIVTGAQMLERQLSDDRQLRNIGRMRSAAGRMVRMIDQLLDLTRARSGGGLQIKREELNAEVLAKSVIEELRLSNPERHIHLNVHGDPHMRGDGDRLQQVLSNLVGNAIRHGDGDSPITVNLDCGDQVVLRIHNQGVIAPELLPVLFDPFRGARTASSSGGLGLGLFISEQIVRTHGGTVDVTSNAKEGTTFTVRLPRGRQAETGSQSWVATPEAQRRQPKVLIVEDLEEILETLEETFIAEGYEVAPATDGAQALYRLENESLPDAIVLDLGLPDISGREIYARLQSTPRLAGIPVVVATAEPAKAPSGAVVIRKPYEADRLVALVGKLSARTPNGR
jgi:two-component system sensor histidine kinase/response regulator